MRTDKDILDSYGVVKITHLNRTAATLLGGKVCVELERGDGMAIYGHGTSTSEALRAACFELRAEISAGIDCITGGNLYNWYCDYDVFGDEPDDWDAL